MTIAVDQNEAPAVNLYLQTLGAPTEVMLLNRPAPRPRPDYGFYTHTGNWRGISRKQAAEYVGGMDECEAQMLEEMLNCDEVDLLIEGTMRPADDGNTYTYQYGTERDFYPKGYSKYAPEARGNVDFYRRYFRIPYAHVRGELAKYQSLGVGVIHTVDMQDTAHAIYSAYKQAQKPGDLFRRIIPEKYRLDEKDADRKRFVLQVMQSVPGGGEELGHALYDAGFRTLTQLIRCFDQYEVVPFMDWQAIARLPLRSGKRTIGQAAVKKIRDALGC